MKHWRETTEIVERVFALVSAGRRAALATVIRIEGSSYRRPGAKFLIEDDGRTLGGVSGGCLEADVREVALRVIQTGTPQLLHYDTGVDDQTVWGLGLGCNGSVDIFVQSATDAGTLEVLRELGARLKSASRSRSGRSSMVLLVSVTRRSSAHCETRVPVSRPTALTPSLLKCSSRHHR